MIRKNNKFESLKICHDVVRCRKDYPLPDAYYHSYLIKIKCDCISELNRDIDKLWRRNSYA